MARRLGYALSAILATTFLVAGAQAESHVRIIRLSYIDGSVQMDRATGEALERAILNTPVTEGVRLVTGNDGLAEVEFENNSTVRLGENSEVRFTKLVVNDAGAKVNEVELVRGTAYFDTKGGKGSKDDIYRATIGDSTFLISHDSQARLSTESGHPSIAVLKGEAELQNESHQVRISKKETLTVDPNNSAGYEIANAVDAAPLDRWNQERSDYQTSYAYSNPGVASQLNGYGYSDLNYYGGWSYLPGIGYGWQPFGVASWIGWNPYLAGAWAFYPGFGYAWASAYPWGWLPYHYGSWSFIGGSGWFWLPGAWSGYRNPGWYGGGFRPVPVVNGPPGWQAPKPPPVAGIGNSAPTVKVGTIGNLPAAIPGGRVPPNFHSMVPGYTAAQNAATLARHPAAKDYATTSAFQHNHGSDTRSIYGPYATGHVFATPPHTAWSGPTAGWSGGHSGAEAGSVGAFHSMGSPGHATGASHASSGHGSPK